MVCKLYISPLRKGHLSTLTLYNSRVIRRFSSRSPQLTLKPTLKRAFDDDEYWNGLLKQNKPSLPLQINRLVNGNKVDNKMTGLFKNPYLHNPQGLKQFSDDSLKFVQDLVIKMKKDTSFDGLLKYIVRLDQVSDTLCRVIDLCEFIRSAHPNEMFSQQAQLCHEQLFEFMNILNTDVELCNILKKILSTDDIRSRLTEEELKVGKILLEDFEKSGIYMKPKTREEFITLTQEISIVGQSFVNGCNSLRDNYIEINAYDLENSKIHESLLQQLSKNITMTHYKVPCFGSLPYILLRTCKNETIRKQIWAALHNCSEKQISRLTQLVKLRARLANIMGNKSYSEYQLQGKMAKTPENVENFIQSLIQFIKFDTVNELKAISDLKSKDMDISPPETMEDILSNVRPWDRDYYSTQNTLNDGNSTATLINYPPFNTYFTLGSVIEGLSNIFNKIYGVSLQIDIPKGNEIWSNDVRKLNVISEDGSIIGVIYCDLFERNAKISSPAHFTICCSREMYPDEYNTSIMQIGQTKNNNIVKKFQLPIISLVCNFSRNDETVCLLQLNDIETLFHEMGHAMHSIFGRTRLQNISGTRCATDFVELPSILMEHFARDRRILETIGKHYITGENIPTIVLIEQLKESKYLQACETFAQAKMSLLDQRLHDFHVLDLTKSIDVVKIYQNLEEELKVLVDDQTNWCGKFGHLFGYGATYYSYLFDRAIAAKVWNKLFQKDPFDRSNGELFKNNVLLSGGLRDPWQSIAQTLQEPTLRKGDAQAMNLMARAYGI